MLGLGLILSKDNRALTIPPQPIKTFLYRDHLLIMLFKGNKKKRKNGNPILGMLQCILYSTVVVVVVAVVLVVVVVVVVVVAVLQRQCNKILFTWTNERFLLC